MKKLIAKVRTLLGAAPTYLTAAAVVVSATSEEIARAFPGAGETIAHVAVPVLAGIAAAVAIVRRVTPVLPPERGL